MVQQLTGGTDGTTVGEAVAVVIGLLLSVGALISVWIILISLIFLHHFFSEKQRGPCPTSQKYRSAREACDLGPDCPICKP